MYMNPRKAMESMDPEPGEVTPRIDPSVGLVSNMSTDLTEADKSQIFLFMLKKHMGVDRFVDLINTAAQELEVYGLIESAEEAKNACNAIAAAHRNEKCSRPIMAIAMKLAAHENSELSRRYMEIEAEEHKVIHEICEQYDDAARKVLGDLLNEYTRKCMMMSGPYAKQIQAIIAQISEQN